MNVTLEQARTIIAAAFADRKDKGFAPMAVVVLDSGGHTVAFEREDGASNMRYQIAFGKAHGALALGIGSRALGRRAEAQPTFIAAATAAIGGALVPVPGGVLLRDEGGAIVGAVGATGDTSDNDEEAAVAGIEAAGLQADTG
jgi:uncharacterized protein GlcG (DUF336 family)